MLIRQMSVRPGQVVLKGVWGVEGDAGHAWQLCLCVYLISGLNPGTG